MKIRIVIADDHRVMREGLVSLFQKEKDIEVVAQASDGKGAVQLAGELSPDVVLVDVSMPLLNGAEACRRILAHNPKIRVVALTMHEERRILDEMLAAGVSGYLLKDGDFSEIANAVRIVAQGKTFFASRIADTLITDYVQHLNKDGAAKSSGLTSREREIVQLLAEGNSVKKIAAQLGLSAKTVDVHRANVMKKLNLRSLPELTKYAIREGITPL